MIRYVTDMNFSTFYGHECYYMLLTWMLTSFMDMNNSTCYWHESYCLLRTWIYYCYWHERYIFYWYELLHVFLTRLIKHVADMNATNDTDIYVTFFYGHEWYKMLLIWLLLSFKDMKVTTVTDINVSTVTNMNVTTFPDMNVINFTDMNIIIFYGHEWY